LSAIAKRYASAFADVAMMRENIAAARAQFASFVDAYAESADLRHFLTSPAIDRATKQAVLEKIAARLDLSETVRNFIYTLVDHRRTEQLGEIRQAIEAELNEREGIVEAHVTSARELSEAEQEEIVGAIERLTQQRVQAKFGSDAALVGGAVVQIGSTIYDGSVREQLARLRAALESETWKV
jgi:F-type H+-transporting ATPase subunit delta